MEEHLVFFTSVLLLGITAQWLAWKWRLPSILLLLGFGFIAGQFYDQNGIVDEETLLAVVSLAVGVIMLEGGLSLKFSELREAGPSVLRLIGPGTLVTWAISAVAARYLAAFSWPVSILLAAMLVVTGPTVIGPLLRTVKPKRHINSILKWEGIVIDPVGAILAVLVFGALFGQGEGYGLLTPGGLVAGLGKTLLIGMGLGYGAACGLSHILARHWVPDFLQSLVVLSVSLGLFALSNLLQHESGLLTVTVIGIGLANQSRAKIRHVIEFKEILRTVLISCLFIVLGARIGLDDLLSVWKESVLFLITLIIIVRPASVFISQWGNRRLSFKEKVFLSLMAPRGIVAAAVSSVFALKLAETGGAYAGEAARLVPVTYTVIVGTVAFYGLCSAPLARYLGLALKNPRGVLFVGISRWSIEAAKLIGQAGFRVLMLDSNYAATRDARMAGVPSLNANILSDYASESLDLLGIGNLVAATPNDEVNTLACINLGHTLGFSHVFQLKPNDIDGCSERKSSSEMLTGRLLGDSSPTSAGIRDLEQAGATVKLSSISAEFSYDKFVEYYGQSAVVLFIISASGELQVQTPQSLAPNPGDQLISLVLDPKSVVDSPEDDAGISQPVM